MSDRCQLAGAKCQLAVAKCQLAVKLTLSLSQSDHLLQLLSRQLRFQLTSTKQLLLLQSLQI